ncbi:DNA-binding MarR family transcriptional regulator [Okibacterium sp. HSC-33S16]|uniref:MarR family winged helix-turn-helix transcriptional regulator n=1 Tax=Okibacterium sp. HSC-33S16 TaxID=2910965 RepID=UPI00209FA472|nr:MarR family transcriptional regulator [Okibacterium sp. HSC-33S16]MCP2032515.1 DNA-binding MarR family transcriptional regulator [Okibacterium sp. HSC-33S16]
MTTTEPAPGSDRHSAAIVSVETSMGALSRKIHFVLKEAAAAIDPSLPPASFRLLRLIERCGSIQSSAAAEQLAVDRSVVSRQIRQLEDLGLVETRTDKSDGRARFLVLTDEGARRMNTINPTQRSIMQPLLQEWELSELETFAAQIDRLNASLERGLGRFVTPGDE